MKRFWTQPTEKQIRESQQQAKREAEIRQMKDLANVAYKGKNE